MPLKQIGFIASTLATFAFLTLSASASDFPDLRGQWTGTYLAATAGKDDQPGPRFNNGEMVMDILKQQDNAFGGTNKWRVIGRDNWRTGEIMGSASLEDPNAIAIMEKSSNPDHGVAGSFDGSLKDGKLYLTFRGLRTGTVYSTVLERTPGN
ncbi:MAG: hypothetical protein ABJN26_18650 [Stappiaceae bacterium]